MFRTGIIAIAILLVTCKATSANDFLLRMETTGFRDWPQRGKQPASKVLESIEIVARVNQSFHGIANVGSTKVSFRGYLEELKDNVFRVKISYRKSSDSGDSVSVPNGAEMAITNSTIIDSTAIVELNKNAEIGKEDGIVRSKKGTELKTLTQSVLSIKKL